jgi:transcriptional regulator with XRE-family HTH domain
MATLILSAADRDTLERLIRDGLSFSEVSRRTGLTRTYVSRYARKRMGITCPPPQPSLRLLRAVALVRDHGYSIRGAAAITGTQMSNVYRACRIRGIRSRFSSRITKTQRAEADRLRAQTPPL